MIERIVNLEKRDQELDWAETIKEYVNTPIKNPRALIKNVLDWLLINYAIRARFYDFPKKQREERFERLYKRRTLLRPEVQKAVEELYDRHAVHEFMHDPTT